MVPCGKGTRSRVDHTLPVQGSIESVFSNIRREVLLAG